MSENSNWGEQLYALLTGALSVWRLNGRVVRDAEKSACCIIQTKIAEVAVERITNDGDTPYWDVALLDPDTTVPPLPYAGLQGMLRAVRDLLDQDPISARLVIGSQAGE
jgi:hypothetical protein